MSKLNVYLAQVNNTFGRNAFLPYSVGLLRAYAQTIPEIKSAFNFAEMLFLREDIPTVIERIDHPRIFGISCYIWNFSYSMALAQATKAAFPRCMIVLGGGHIPLESENFFKSHPYADILVHYEGEMPFADILKESLNDRPDFTRIPGLTVRIEGVSAYKTPPRTLPPTDVLAAFPSPYLSGTFDHMMTLPHDFHPMQETQRGCPYPCTFCQYGPAFMTSVRPLPDWRVFGEIDWFAKHDIDLLYNADANFGLLPRDMQIAEALVRSKRERNAPRKFRAAWAKNSGEKILAIAKVLSDAGMSKGISLSFQSMHEPTLKAVKRRNIQIANLKKYLRFCREEKVPTYTELILGLPLETYDSFTDGIAKILEAGQHDSLNVYIAEMLPNTEMNTAEDRSRYGLKTVTSPVLFYHATPSTDLHTEYYEIVIATNTMSEEDWRRAYIFSWAVQCFHSLGLTQFLALFFNRNYGISYRTFYETLINYGNANPKTVIGQQCRLVYEQANDIQQGKTWGIVDQRFGNISWPLEEGTFLKVIAEKDALDCEVEAVVRMLINNRAIAISNELLQDLFIYQNKLIVNPFSPKTFTFSLAHNLHQYLRGAYIDEVVTIEPSPQRVTVTAEQVFGGDLITYAREVVWYGRKGGKLTHTNIMVQGKI